MTARLALAWALSALSAFSGCVGAPDHCVSTEVGEVRASTAARAEEAAAQLDLFAGRIREILPGVRTGPLEVWMQPEAQVFWGFSDESTPGFVSDWNRRIHLTESHQDVWLNLAHEMVHAMLGDAWDGLPPTLEEGLADHVSARVTDDAPRIRGDRYLRAMAAAEGPEIRLRFERADGGWTEQVAWVRYPRDDDFRLVNTFSSDGFQVSPAFGTAERPLWYGLAMVAADRLMERLDADGLLELCARADALGGDDARDLFADAAGLGDDPDSWWLAIERHLTADVREAMAEQLAPQMAAQTFVELSTGDARPDWEQVVACRPRLRFGGSDEFVELVDVEAFRRAIEAPPTSMPE